MEKSSRHIQSKIGVSGKDPMPTPCHVMLTHTWGEIEGFGYHRILYMMVYEVLDNAECYVLIPRPVDFYFYFIFLITKIDAYGYI